MLGTTELKVRRCRPACHNWRRHSATRYPPRPERVGTGYKRLLYQADPRIIKDPTTITCATSGLSMTIGQIRMRFSPPSQ